LGQQTWIGQNLNVDKYKNCDLIPKVKNSEEWENLKTVVWYYNNNKNENGKNMQSCIIGIH